MKLRIAIIIMILLSFLSFGMNLYEDKKCFLSLSQMEPFVNFLNEKVPEFASLDSNGFHFDEEKCYLHRFNIQDLTNESVISYSDRKFSIENNHVYHFYAYESLSFSHIAYLNGAGEITFFEAVNCKDRGTEINEVIDFLSSELAMNENKEKILDQVKRYYEYKKSATICDIPVFVECDCEH